MILPVDRVNALRRKLLDGPQDFAAEWLQEGAKVAVPFEPSRHLSPEEADRLAAALAKLEQHEVLGFSSESYVPDIPVDGVIVTAEPDELLKWDEQFALFDAVIVTKDLGAAIVFGTDEYGVAAGPRQFVEEFLGMSVEQACEEFVRFAEDWKEASRHLPSVAQRYGCVLT